MNSKLLCSVLFFTFLALLHQPVELKKVVIHVPYRVQNVKHTHTIYRLIPHHREAKHREDEEGYYDDYRKR